MPHTTLVASSCAITLPPAATISLPPRMPSEPMPVRIDGQDAALPDVDRGREQRIDGGLAEIDRRAVIERDRDVRAAAHDAHVAAAGREIDLARLDDLAVDGLMRRACLRPRARCSARMVVKVGGMCWVISTGKRSITGPISAHQRHQRLRAAGRRADQQRARRRAR